MSTKELKLQIEQYHSTLLKERTIKNQLVKKLEAVRKVVSSYRPRNRSSRTASKAAGIPFGLSTLAAAAFIPTNNAGDEPESKAELLLKEVKLILG